MIPRLIIASALLCSFLSCHYRFLPSTQTAHVSTIEVPYVENAPDGQLTEAIIEQLAFSTSFRYVPSGGDVALICRVDHIKHQNIGYVFQNNSSGRPTDTLSPNETRKTMVLEVSLINPKTKEVLLPPTQISAEVDFDYGLYQIEQKDVNFSMGQLNPYYTADQVAFLPLYEKISKKIVNLLNMHSWEKFQAGSL